jgi:hypothetical protein
MSVAKKTGGIEEKWSEIGFPFLRVATQTTS